MSFITVTVSIGIVDADQEDAPPPTFPGPGWQSLDITLPARKSEAAFPLEQARAEITSHVLGMMIGRNLGDIILLRVTRLGRAPHGFRCTIKAPQDAAALIAGRMVSAVMAEYDLDPQRQIQVVRR